MCSLSSGLGVPDHISMRRPAQSCVLPFNRPHLDNRIFKLFDSPEGILLSS